ncbi:hypothetical protein VCHENC02_0922B, partial [Vibrio harveyi]
ILTVPRYSSLSQ